MDVAREEAFFSEDAAYQRIESLVWPEGAVCPHCGDSHRIGRLGGRMPRPGTLKCYSCRKPFNVKIGTRLESTHVPLHLWLQALFLLHACDRPLSVNRLQKVLGVSSRTSWMIAQRIRAAIAEDDGAAEASPPSQRAAARAAARAEAMRKTTGPSRRATMPAREPIHAQGGAR